MSSNNNPTTKQTPPPLPQGRQKWLTANKHVGTWNRSTGCPTHCFSLVVCHHPTTQQWLAVEETKQRGWWLPGGFVDCGDDFTTAAHRETLEEAGMEIDLQGILRVEQSMSRDGARQRVIFYATPRDPHQRPKQHADQESLGAQWMSLAQLQQLAKLDPPQGLRGTELLDWATYIEGGGVIYPLDVFVKESTPVPKPPLLQQSQQPQPKSEE